MQKKFLDIKKVFFLTILLSTFLQVQNVNAKIKNIILFIGDGMGPQQVGLMESYAQFAKSPLYKNKKTSFSEILKSGELAISNHQAHGHLIVDSACSATQLATGKYTKPERVGIDKNGKKQQTILELAKSQGKSVGLVTDTKITHATPASFAAHQIHRSQEANIAEDLLKADLDVAFGAGLDYFLPNNLKENEILKLTQEINNPFIKVNSKRKDNKNLLQKIRKTHKVVFNKKQFQNLGADVKKAWGFFGNSAQPFGLMMHKNKKLKTKFPEHHEITIKAIDILSKNKKGFFLMVEAGQIDWAGHDNDAGMLLHEMIKAERTLANILNWIKNRKEKDTILVMTADHETGGFGFSYHMNVKSPPKKLSPQLNYGDLNIYKRLYRQKTTQKMMLQEVYNLPKKERKLALIKSIQENLGYKITFKEAKEILNNRVNPYYMKGHKRYGHKTWANINEKLEFYNSFDNARSNKLALVMGKYTNIVWSTGGHTSTPVYVMSYGPKAATDKFRGSMHHTQLGKRLMSFIK